MDRPPATPAEFDRAYRLPLTVWGDVRIPPEVKALVTAPPSRSLELGCGVGRFSRYLAQQGMLATGVDFSPVAIDKARQRTAGDAGPATYLVGDVTRLHLAGPYEVSFDVGCFHCLSADARRAYADEVYRVLAIGGTHLIWALDDGAGGGPVSATIVGDVFATNFVLTAACSSRRRLAASHWYWLRKVDPSA